MCLTTRLIPSPSSSCFVATQCELISRRYDRKLDKWTWVARPIHGSSKPTCTGPVSLSNGRTVAICTSTQLHKGWMSEFDLDSETWEDLELVPSARMPEPLRYS